MKFVVAFAFIFFVGALAISDNDDEEFEGFAVACANETNVDLSGINSLGKFEMGKIVGNEKFDCLVTCLLKKYYILTSDGNLNGLLLSVLKPNKMPQDDFERLLEKCKDIDGDNICQKGGRLLKCFTEDEFFEL